MAADTSNIIVDGFLKLALGQNLELDSEEPFPFVHNFDIATLCCVLNTEGKSLSKQCKEKVSFLPELIGHFFFSMIQTEGQ